MKSKKSQFVAEVVAEAKLLTPGISQEQAISALNLELARARILNCQAVKRTLYLNGRRKSDGMNVCLHTVDMFALRIGESVFSLSGTDGWEKIVQEYKGAMDKEIIELGVTSHSCGPDMNVYSNHTLKICDAVQGAIERVLARNRAKDLSLAIEREIAPNFGVVNRKRKI